MIDNKKVKIKTDDILSRGKYSPKFTKFIIKNKNKIFTAKLALNHRVMYELMEDTSSPKWLFWENDLEKIED